MLRCLPPFVLLIAGAGILSGCSRLDSYNRPYTWHPTGANLANIAAQVVHPEDLVVGHGSDQTDAAPLMPGIQQVDTGVAKPMGGGASSGGSGASGGAS
ncbi:MAG: hypothetical protein ACREFY_14895 [Acetobacteraceae bacterium]